MFVFHLNPGKYNQKAKAKTPAPVPILASRSDGSYHFDVVNHSDELGDTWLEFICGLWRTATWNSACYIVVLPSITRLVAGTKAAAFNWRIFSLAVLSFSLLRLFFLCSFLDFFVVSFSVSALDSHFREAFKHHKSPILPNFAVF